MRRISKHSIRLAALFLGLALAMTASPDARAQNKKKCPRQSENDAKQQYARPVNSMTFINQTRFSVKLVIADGDGDRLRVEVPKNDRVTVNVKKSRSRARILPFTFSIPGVETQPMLYRYTGGDVRYHEKKPEIHPVDWTVRIVYEGELCKGFVFAVCAGRKYLDSFLRMPGHESKAIANKRCGVLPAVHVRALGFER